jgi:hypothetical protein
METNQNHDVAAQPNGSSRSPHGNGVSNSGAAKSEFTVGAQKALPPELPFASRHPQTLDARIDLGELASGSFSEAGDYASRPPGELHGPFKTEEGCVVLEVSFPNRGQD